MPFWKIFLCWQSRCWINLNHMFDHILYNVLGTIKKARKCFFFFLLTLIFLSSIFSKLESGLYSPLLYLNSWDKVNKGVPSRNNSAITHLTCSIKNDINIFLSFMTYPTEKISMAGVNSLSLSFTAIFLYINILIWAISLSFFL